MRWSLIGLVLASVAAIAPSAGAQTVWSGYDFSFAKANGTDHTLPENQDRITPSIWLSRALTQGLFNVASETSWDMDSPIDTEWATDLNNMEETIAATNWAELTFEPWIAAYGGTLSGQLPSRLIGRNAVVHLISDDIYLDLRFTAWTQGSGGGFAYVHALPPEDPETTGDYNQDGVVDGADYVVWRKTLNDAAVPAGSGADGDGDGMVDEGDYDFWLERFGETVSPASGGAALAVPEPMGLAQILVGFVVSGLTNRGRCPRIAPR
jgi:hypothetical protein